MRWSCTAAIKIRENKAIFAIWLINTTCPSVHLCKVTLLEFITPAKERKRKDRRYKRVAQIRRKLSKLPGRFIAVKNSSLPIPVTGLFWQGCFDNAARSEIKRHWSVKGPDPQRRRGQSCQEHKAGGCSKSAVVVPQERRWCGGKVNAKDSHYGRRVFYFSFLPKHRVFSKQNMTSVVKGSCF